MRHNKEAKEITIKLGEDFVCDHLGFFDQLISSMARGN